MNPIDVPDDVLAKKLQVSGTKQPFCIKVIIDQEDNPLMIYMVAEGVFIDCEKMAQAVWWTS